MKNQGWFILNIFLFSLIILSCDKVNPEPEFDYLSFPIGRSFINSSEVTVKIGGLKYDADVISDSSGGYWLIFPKGKIEKSDDIKIQFTRKKEDLVLFNGESNSKTKWTAASYYIDSDNDEIRTKANELTVGLNSNVEKAKKIQQFVISHIQLNSNKKYSFYIKASKTYEEREGTCMNFSRLFVALCRAANIPARTIWGIVYNHDGGNIYDYHHQWAEVLDENGYWHPADFNYSTVFDLNDIRYLDLIYAAEENNFISKRSTTEIMIPNLKYYNNYPVVSTGRLGFKLLSNQRPDSMIIEYTFKLRQLSY